MNYPYYYRDLKHLKINPYRKWAVRVLLFVLILIGISGWATW